ncbi:YhfG family protein [Pseudomonas silvicola]|nr:YhfG family protein [Pseudomonas silvicola]
MESPSFQVKKAYYAKVRRSNYTASLRLEGFEVTPEDAERPLPTRESVISRYRKKAD